MPPRKARRVSRKADLRMPDLIGNPSAPTFAPSQIRILSAILDITLLLGQLQLDAEGKPEMAEICKIRLSPQHAKALAALLTAKVIEYESEVGPISLPEVEETRLRAGKGG